MKNKTHQWLQLCNGNVSPFPKHDSLNAISTVMSIQYVKYVNQSESLYILIICQEANGVSKESTCADNMKL
jgi:hypothetical protein